MGPTGYAALSSSWHCCLGTRALNVILLLLRPGRLDAAPDALAFAVQLVMDEAHVSARATQRSDMSVSDQVDIAEAVRVLCCHWRGTLWSVEMQGQLGAPDWAGYELRIWRLRESLRSFLRRKKGWRGRGPALDAVAAALRDEGNGKGRQTLALLLGDFGGQEYGDVLAAALGDSDLAGRHAIKALTKARIRGYEGQVAAIQARERGWIRSAAKNHRAVTGHGLDKDEPALRLVIDDDVRHLPMGIDRDTKRF